MSGKAKWWATYYSEPFTDPAESENPRMRRHSMFENRETSEVSAAGCTAGRSGKVCGRNPDMHVFEESDIGIVPMKEPNKATWPHVAAEVSEGRPMTKGNSEESSAICTQR